MTVLPSVAAIEYDTALDTQQAWVEEQAASLDINELVARLLNGENVESIEQELAENRLANCILMPLKWLANILLKVLVLPLKLVVKIMVKLLVLPFTFLSATFKLLLLPVKLLLLPLKITMISLKIILKIVTLPLKIVNLMMFLLCPFKHPLRS
jgi:hypothetical protein